MEKWVVMNGGDGPNSYTQNSKTQGEALERAKALLSNSIQQELTIGKHNSKVFTIADLGCSVGPNTYSCVNTIIDAVNATFNTSTHHSQMPEFHVFFNDHVTNDFNTLFKNLPAERHYMAAGVPGSFHGRLFPEASVDLFHSSSSLHWLSELPERVTNRDSPAWNRGKISYVESCSEVVEAFRDQFAKDAKVFFSARSVEMAEDGLLAVYLLGRPDGTVPSESTLLRRLELCLGQALADMATEGMVSKALVDSFNIPFYVPNVSEMRQVISSIKNLSIVKTGEICFSENVSTLENARTLGGSNVRAVFEGMLSKHFGGELDMDELFERCAQKLHKLSKMPLSIEKLEFLFVLVKRNSWANIKNDLIHNLNIKMTSKLK